MYKTIMVHVDAGDSGTSDRVQCAMSLAVDCKASLVGVSVALAEATVELLASGGAAIAGGVLMDDPTDLEQRFAADRAAFAGWTAGTDLQTEWRTAVDFPAVGMANMASRADLIVVGPQHRSSASNGYLDYGELVMTAGRPVLVVPHGVSKLTRSGAIVAWRNTRESRRALADSLPLLATYNSVTLLNVREGKEPNDASLADADAYLAAHSIGAVVQTIETGKRSTAEAIVDYAERRKAELIIAGAFGHSRVREWAFGGVTRELFRGSPITCLLSR